MSHDAPVRRQRTPTWPHDFETATRTRPARKRDGGPLAVGRQGVRCARRRPRRRRPVLVSASTIGVWHPPTDMHSSTTTSASAQGYALYNDNVGIRTGIGLGFATTTKVDVDTASWMAPVRMSLGVVNVLLACGWSFSSRSAASQPQRQQRHPHKDSHQQHEEVTTHVCDIGTTYASYHDASLPSHDIE